MGLRDYNSNANQNTTIAGIDIAEGCAPSGINNAIRQLMADLAAGVGGGLKELTRAQYETLPESKLTDNVAYLITDEGVIIRNGVSFGKLPEPPDLLDMLGLPEFPDLSAAAPGQVLTAVEREGGGLGLEYAEIPDPDLSLLWDALDGKLDASRYEADAWGRPIAFARTDYNNTLRESRNIAAMTRLSAGLYKYALLDAPQGVPIFALVTQAGTGNQRYVGQGFAGPTIDPLPTDPSDIRVATRAMEGPATDQQHLVLFFALQGA